MSDQLKEYQNRDVGRNITQHSSSVLAARLEEALNPDLEAGREHSLSLAPVPALIPKMSGPEIAAIRKLMSMIPAYRAIFGKDKHGSTDGNEGSPLIDRMDAVLTSLSTHQHSLRFSGDNLIETAGVTRGELNDLVIGDICGALIPRSNLNKKAQDDVKSIVERWTGVKLEKLKDCALRAKDGAPGIVALAIGANKGQVAHDAIRSGLIQHFFIDQDLSDELERICSVSAS